MDNLFVMALQSSMVLGLVHGINPCGHSWLVIAPFVTGDKNGRRVSLLTVSFLAGTTVACLLLGLSLGSLSLVLPEGLGYWVDMITAVALVSLGIILLINPHLLHSHDHDHYHDHSHDHHHHDHSHDHHNHYRVQAFEEEDAQISGTAGEAAVLSKGKKATGAALFGVGFVNMIIPCPTVSIMYSYALESGSYLKATTVFGVYALGTSLAVSAVIFGIFKVTSLLKTLSQDWIEGAVMRSAGLLTLLFGAYSGSQLL